MLKSVWPGIVSCCCQPGLSSTRDGTYVELLHCLDILLRRFVDVIVGVVQLVVLEVTCSTAPVSDAHIMHECVDLRVGRVARI